MIRLYRHVVACSTCEGWGVIRSVGWLTVTCPSCGGAGVVYR